MAPSRRLAAVMFTDLSNFTSLTRQDEAKTLRLLMEHRAIVRPIVERFSGRVVKTLGDGFLVEFDSALNAMQCAVEVQLRCLEWVHESEELRPQIRIALHVGDVVDDEGDILGDAVNLASRLEPLAEPGGICVSGPVFEQVRHRVSLEFEKLPAPRLRGIDAPPDVYRVVLPRGSGALLQRPAPPGRIAVLPFQSISPDPQDSYLADGLTEELIHALSQIGGLRVIARTSTDVYRERPAPVSRIGTELNVRSLLEGSVRRHGNQIRVTAQLVDVTSQEHLWSESYDRALDDVFAIQTEIARHVAATLKVKVLEQEERRLNAKPTGVTGSYLAYLKGRTLLRALTEEGLRDARHEFEEAIRLDPKNARAYSGLADAIHRAAWISDRPLAHLLAALETGRELVSTSLLIDPNAAEAHASLGYFLDELFDFAGADRELRTAIALNPSYAPAHQWYGRLLTDRGRLDEALAEYRIAEQADPLSPGIRFGLVSLLAALGRSPEVAAERAVLEGLQPDGLYVHLVEFERTWRAGDDVGLLREVRWLTDHAPEHSRKEREAAWFGLYHAKVGESEKARQCVAVLESLHRGPPEAVAEWAPDEIAQIYAQLGDLTECFRWLELAVRQRAITFAHWWLSAVVEPARRDPRFRRLLRPLGLI